MKDIAASLLDPLAALATNPRTGTLMLLLVIAAVTDYRTFRIPNWLTVGGACVALGLAIFLPAASQPDLLWAFAGLATGLFIMMPMYALKIMGAGDVKLMGMAGAFLGLPDTLYAVFFTFVAGGLAALLFALWHRSLGRMAGNVRNILQSFAFAAFAGHRPPAPAAAAASIGRLPYGISICLGTIASLASKQLGFA